MEYFVKCNEYIILKYTRNGNKRYVINISTKLLLYCKTLTINNVTLF